MLEACRVHGTHQTRPTMPTSSSPSRTSDSSPRRRGCLHLNHLSLCSPQLNGSGQLKMSSHCLSAQMLAPPPPGLPRLALPPATKPTSEGGSTSPTSPCKHSGSGACGRAGVPKGPPPLPSPTAGVGGSGPAWWVLASSMVPQIEAIGSGLHGARTALGHIRGKSAVFPDWPSGLGSPFAHSGPLSPPPCEEPLTISEGLQLVA